jgi:hypothetical protein
MWQRHLQAREDGPLWKMQILLDPVLALCDWNEARLCELCVLHQTTGPWLETEAMTSLFPWRKSSHKVTTCRLRIRWESHTIFSCLGKGISAPDVQMHKAHFMGAHLVGCSGGLPHGRDVIKAGVGVGREWENPRLPLGTGKVKVIPLSSGLEAVPCIWNKVG